MDRVKIRRAKLGDEGAIEQLYRQLHADYKSPGAQRMRRAFQAMLDNPDHTILVAVKEGEILGAIHVLIFRHLARTLRPMAIVENVVVDSGSRGAGVGKRLVAAAVEIARREKCYRLSLTTNRKRKDAHRFYERLGWQRTHFCFTLPLIGGSAQRSRT
jgi:GNAT superfamily N-acetyltransferase